MRKIKKINGYLIVMFNDREIRAWAGTGLGKYGVIEAEFYTGSIGVDRSVMEYDSAETLEEAIEQARGLESELEVDETAATYTIIKENDENTEENVVDPQSMIAGWKTELEAQVKSHHYPSVNQSTAAHELYGFKVALKWLGLIEEDECFVLPNTFGTGFRDDFLNLPEANRSAMSERVYALGLKLTEDCPMNDCRIYLNVFNMCREIDEQIDRLSGWPRELLERELRRQYHEIEGMFMMNYAVQCYRREIRAKQKEPPLEEATPRSVTVFLPYKCPDMRGLRLFLEEWQQENRAHRSWLEKSFQCFLEKWERDRGF